jgi:hypothetical protein
MVWSTKNAQEFFFWNNCVANQTIFLAHRLTWQTPRKVICSCRFLFMEGMQKGAWGKVDSPWQTDCIFLPTVLLICVLFPCNWPREQGRASTRNRGRRHYFCEM